MTEALIPMVVSTSMFAMIFGIVYIKSRENMALIEKGINPKQNGGYRPRPFVNLKWGLLLIGCGLGLLTAYIIDSMLPKHPKTITEKVVINNKIDSTSTDTINHARKQIIISNGGKTTKINTNLEQMDNEDSNDENDKDSNSCTIHTGDSENPAIYLALIAIGGGLGLFFSYRIEKKEWLDKNKPE